MFGGQKVACVYILIKQRTSLHFNANNPGNIIGKMDVFKEVQVRSQNHNLILTCKQTQDILDNTVMMIYYTFFAGKVHHIFHQALQQVRRSPGCGANGKIDAKIVKFKRKCSLSW